MLTCFVAVYSAIQVWSETGLGRTEEAVSYLENMDRLEKSGHLVQDANEGKWIVDSLQRIVNHNAPQEVKTRAEELIKQINQRLMSQYPLGTRVPMSQEKIWEELEAAGYMRTPAQQVMEQQKPEEKQEQPRRNEDDEMAATAGRLLERVADNTSEKFQNSQFLELMRKLRDREVRVQEDKIVDVNTPAAPATTTSATTATTSQIPTSSSNTQVGGTTIPPIDSSILSHAATDFEQPIYSDQGHEDDHLYDLSRHESFHASFDEPFLTDEISEQFRYWSGNR